MKNILLLESLHCIVLISLISTINYVFFTVYIDLSIQWKESFRVKILLIFKIFLIIFCFTFAFLLIGFLEIGNENSNIPNSTLLALTIVDNSFWFFAVGLLGIISCKLNSKFQKTAYFGISRQGKIISKIRFIFLSFFQIMVYLVVDITLAILINSNDKTIV